MTTGIEPISELIPFSLEHNYPNPFRESTYFPIDLRKRSDITLCVYDVFGRKVATIINSQLDAGEYIEEFDNNKYQLSPGVYFFTLRAGNLTKTQKMLLIE